jgi:hypothetical protein
MAKRSVTELESGQSHTEPLKASRSGAVTNAAKRTGDDEGMGEFEDEWEDEIESDGEVNDGGADSANEDGMFHAFFNAFLHSDRPQLSWKYVKLQKLDKKPWNWISKGTSSLQ